MKSEILNSYSIKELKTQINDTIKNRGINPTLAFIYLSPNYNIRKVVAELNEYDFLILGATTDGEIFANEQHGAKEKEGTIVCMLLEINPLALSLRLFQIESQDYYQAGRDVSNWAKEQFDEVALITITSGLAFDNDAYTQSIVKEGIEYVFGGVAADNLMLKDTFVFSKENFSNHGAIALALDLSKINIAGTKAFGWSGIGRSKTITKAEKNIVYEIDDKPAVEFYKKYLNLTNEDMPQVGIEYPLEVVMKNKQVCYRAVLAINEEDGSLVFAGHVEEKSKIRLASAKGIEIIDEVEESIEELMQNQIDFKPEIGLLFPCCSRKQILGDMAIKEIEAVYKHAQIPLIGLYLYGEIGVFSSDVYGFQNETFVTALLSEKKETK